ncbi:hypothetical protein EOA78_26280 [Mesorhizobium sp. M5C.F.Cr.IN.023.01.1.1]|uniref:hypothetical protein n=1 Tax=Mesorhizobium sp. M5C.F.Cr.IN.023.01.1.1 TaxID=2496768 RepID=UPI000FCC5B5B|nr:hypothetical protein [Mesorhizobium sp. M5C.F.Cr.IN.023.01.1.1]RUV68592.1 hypothetical protein EOA78_26280 [Mesorhizobium sp. M5C.F.Cr.IN.023.01.1.1]
MSVRAAGIVLSSKGTNLLRHSAMAAMLAGRWDAPHVRHGLYRSPDMTGHNARLDILVAARSRRPAERSTPLPLAP